jgi:hypothetical protein
MKKKYKRKQHRGGDNLTVTPTMGNILSEQSVPHETPVLSSPTNKEPQLQHDSLAVTSSTPKIVFEMTTNNIPILYYV